VVAGALLEAFGMALCKYAEPEASSTESFFREIDVTSPELFGDYLRISRVGFRDVTQDEELFVCEQGNRLLDWLGISSILICNLL
jgi:hypothetical protein